MNPEIESINITSNNFSVYARYDIIYKERVLDEYTYVPSRQLAVYIGKDIANGHGFGTDID